MKPRRLAYASKGVSVLALAWACLLYSQPALAQMSDDEQAPVRDENGVDILSQQFSYVDEINSISIGPTLRYDHVVGGDPTDVRPDISRQVLVWLTGSPSAISISTESGGPYVTGVERKYFDEVSSSPLRWEARNGDQSFIVLQGNDEFLYTDPSGRKITFKQYQSQRSGGLPTHISQIANPEGEIVAFSNRLTGTGNNTLYVGPQTISSNTGYMLQFEYVSDTDGQSGYDQISAVNGYNLAYDTCAVGALHCTIVSGRPRVTFSYSTDTVNVTNSAGAQSKFFASGPSNARVLNLRLPTGYNGNYNNITVNHSNDRVSSVVKNGNTYSYSWTLLGSTSSATVTRPDSETEEYTFRHAPLGIVGSRLYSATDGEGRTTSWDYDSLWRVDKITYPDGRYLSLTRDSHANVTQRLWVSETPGTPANITESATFPSSCTNMVLCHLPTSTTDANLQVTNFTYDSTHGGVLTATLPAASGGGTRPQTRYSYTARQAYYKNGSGQVVASGQPIYKLTSQSSCLTSANCTGQADELKITTTYGPQTNGTPNNLLPQSITQASGNGALSVTRGMAYDPVGNMTSLDGPLSGSGDTTAFKYNSVRQLVGVISPDPDGAGSLPNLATKYSYTAQGALSLEEHGTTPGQSDSDWANFSADWNIATSYNDANQPTIQWVRVGSSNIYSLAQFKYDTMQRLQCSTTRMNPAVFLTITATDPCTLGTAGTLGKDRIVKYTYNGADQVTKIESGYATSAVSAEQYAYLSTGNLSHVIDPNLNRTTYTYDGFGRLEFTKYPVQTKGANTSSTTDYEKRTYDAMSNITELQLRDGTSMALTYDNLNRLSSRTPPSEPTVNFSYNLLGMTTSVQRPSDSFTINYTYDVLGRVKTESQPFGGGLSGYNYDSAGNVTLVVWPDSFNVRYDYDLLGRVTRIYRVFSSPLALFDYNDRGLRKTVTYGNGTTRDYEYDAIDRLSGLKVNLAGTTDDLVIGQIASTGSPIAYNPASQISSISKNNDAYAYAGRSNLSRSYTTNGLNQYTAAGGVSASYDARGNLTSDGTGTYGYNKLNELTSASIGSTSLALTFDPVGRLSRYDVTNGSTVTTRFGYWGSRLFAEVNSSGTILRRFIHTPATDEPILWYEGSSDSDPRYLQADERGSIIALSNGSGAKININSYDEFGVPASGNMGRFQYTGQTWFSEAGLYNYKARFYSPKLGRFMQTDPIGYAGGINWYNYVGGDPINLVDPTGLDDCPGEAPASQGGDICVSRRPPPPTRPSSGGLGNAAPYLWYGGNYGSAAPGFAGSIPIPQSGPTVLKPQSSPQKGLLDYGKDLICGLPAVSPGVGADLYAGAGGSLGGGLNIDIAKGQFGVTGSLAVGLGLGVAVGPGVSAGPSGSSIVSANLAVGGGFALPVAPGVNVGGSAGYNVLGTDPGFSGGSIGRFGTPLGYVNGGANFGFNTPSLYNLGCNK